MSSNQEFEFNLATLEGFARLYMIFKGSILNSGYEVKGIYCPTCGDRRRVKIVHVDYPNGIVSRGESLPSVLNNAVPQTVEDMLEVLGQVTIAGAILIKYLSVNPVKG